MIIKSLCTRQIHFQTLMYCRASSYLYTKRPPLNTPVYSKNNSLCLHQSNRSISSVTFPSWFVALSNSPPVSYAQQFVISFHEMAGTPWWATIMLSAVSLRLIITLPLTVYQVGILNS